MGTRGTYMAHMIDEVRKLVQWCDKVNIVGSDSEQDKQREYAIKKDLEKYGMTTTVQSAAESDFQAVKDTMADLKLNKQRVIFFVGSEYDIAV